jgi:hypothetical protein
LAESHCGDVLEVQGQLIVEVKIVFRVAHT